MQPVSDATHRVLSYLLRIHTQGHGIGAADLDAFFSVEEPSAPMGYSNLSDLKKLHDFRWGAPGLGRSKISKLGAKHESFSMYAEDVGWVRYQGDSGMLRLTPLGVAFATALNAPAPMDDGGYAEVVVQPGEQFGYLRILEVFASHGPGLLVDAYLKTKQFMEVAEATQINRFLIGEKAFGRPRDADSERKMMQLALGAASGAQMRISEGLHDRFFIPDRPGAIWMLGISLNGTEKNFSVLTKLEGESASAIRGIVDGKWAEAVALEAEQSPEESTPIEQD